MADMLLGGIIINEILVDPNGANNFDTDNNGTANSVDEYVELYNTSAVAIDISGLQLWDQGVGNWFTFPVGTILQPGAHAMVMSGVQMGGSLPTGGPDDLFFDSGRGSPLINNTGDNVVVLDPANAEFIQATFNGDPLDNPVATYSGFPAATRNGLGEDFGFDIDGFSLQRGPDGSNTFVNDQTPTPGTTNVCFTRTTLFDTPNGPTPVERLRPRDLLTTRGNGARSIRWVWTCTHSEAAIRSNPMLNTIRIGRGALGNGLPRRELRVSRHHRLLLVSKIAQRMFDSPEILVAAKDLTAFEGIDIAPVDRPITYYHILLERHEILFAEGTAAESLYLGKETLATINPGALDELRLLFGDAWGDILQGAPEPACLMVKGRRIKRFIARHLSNGHAPASVANRSVQQGCSA